MKNKYKTKFIKYNTDGSAWLNETEADKLVPNKFQSENSAVVV